MKRTCFYIPVDGFVPGKGFVPSIVTEGEPGHSPLVGPPGGTPYYWGMTYDEACAVAAKVNADKGLTKEDVQDIIFSSMMAGQS